jgi:hypothetical protein
MLASQAPRGKHRVLGTALDRAALRHLALLLLLTPLLGGLRLLVGHLDTRPAEAPVVVREVVEVPRTEYVRVEVPRTEYVQVEVPGPTVIVEVPMRASGPTEVAPPTSASVGPERVALATTTLAESTNADQPSAAPVLVRVPARSFQPGPPEQAFESAATEAESTDDQVAEAPAAEPAAVAEAPTAPAPASPAQQALADFYAYTERSWSAQGYSSADEMREALGNSTTGWLNKTSREVGKAEVAAPSVGTAPVAANEPASSSQQARKPPAEPATANEAVAAVPAAPLTTETGPASAEPAGTTPEATADEVAVDSAPVAEGASGQPPAADSSTAEATAPTTVDTAADPAAGATQLAARSPETLDGFYAYTDQNWSVQGYSSAEEMRRALGSSWLERARKADQAATGN